MISRIKALKNAMDEYDKTLVGEYVFDIKELRGDQAWAIYLGIDSYKAYRNILNPEKVNFVVDNLGNEAIIPADYNQYLETYNITNAYFSDMLPTFYQINFNKDGLVGIIYFICEVENQQSIYLNDDAVTIFKNMKPEEITNLVVEAQKERSRK